MQRILSLAVVATQLRQKRQGLRPRPVSLRVDWAKPGRFGSDICFMFIDGTDLFCADYGVDACSNTSSHFGKHRVITTGQGERQGG